MSLADASVTGALSGIHILDFTHVLAGPFGTMILADLGADVLKVERPLGGDSTRYMRAGKDDHGFYFGSVNRNKSSIVIDLKNPEGLKLAERLADKADVVVENYGPGVADKLGIGPAALRARNPRLIYASVTGFGRDGPWAERTGVDQIIQALSGIMSLTGERGRQPVRVGISLSDLSGGLFLAIGILAALQERERSGMGQSLDVSLLETQMALLENPIARYLNTGQVAHRLPGNQNYLAFSSFETSDGWLATGFTNANWERACSVLGHPEWPSDAEFRSPQENDSKIAPKIQEILRRHSTQHWLEGFERVGIQANRVLSIGQATELPPIVERGFIQETLGDSGQVFRIVGSPIRLSRTPGRVRTAAPVLGQHSRSSLKSWLQMGDDEYQRLEEAGVLQLKEGEPGSYPAYHARP